MFCLPSGGHTFCLWQVMNQSDSIVCKPTSWFLFRALMMLGMFGMFTVLFYLDASTGYRQKNEVYFLHRTFERADNDFGRMNSAGGLTPDEWRRYAAQQTVDFPADRTLLPASLVLPQPWPEILCDYQRMKLRQWNLLWREYSKQRKLDVAPKEEPMDARKIQEQWVVFWICLALTVGTALVMLRTMRRSITADNEAITTPQGRRIAYTDITTLDLRKWETKGLAFLDYAGPSGKGRFRLDGLTYGGFKLENDEPAERLMRLIRSRFAGELIEYATLAPTDTPAAEESGHS